MHVVVLFSGGKDSVFATFVMQSQGFDISLLTVIPQEYSMMFHHQNVKWTSLQAKAMGLENKHEIINASDDKWFQKVKNKLIDMGAEGIATGAYASEYQRQRIDMLAEELNIPSCSPLWHREFHKELKDFEIDVIGVSADGLGKEYIGKQYSKIIDIVGPSLEGGEAETFVLDAPFFNKKIKIIKSKKIWDNIRGSEVIEDAVLINKST